MIAGYPSRAHLIDHLAALEREKGSVATPAHLRAIEDQIAIFEAELESLGDGDYEPPERVTRKGRFSWVGDFGRPLVR